MVLAREDGPSVVGGSYFCPSPAPILHDPGHIRGDLDRILIID